MSPWCSEDDDFSSMKKRIGGLVLKWLSWSRVMVLVFVN